jgi:hypothetical protein
MLRPPTSRGSFPARSSARQVTRLSRCTQLPQLRRAVSNAPAASRKESRTASLSLRHDPSMSRVVALLAVLGHVPVVRHEVARLGRRCERVGDCHTAVGAAKLDHPPKRGVPRSEAQQPTHPQYYDGGPTSLPSSFSLGNLRAARKDERRIFYALPRVDVGITTPVPGRPRCDNRRRQSEAVAHIMGVEWSPAAEAERVVCDS